MIDLSLDTIFDRGRGALPSGAMRRACQRCGDGSRTGDPADRRGGMARGVSGRRDRGLAIADAPPPAHAIRRGRFYDYRGNAVPWWLRSVDPATQQKIDIDQCK